MDIEPVVGAEGRPKILLAEDDVTQRVLYTRILIAAGYYVFGVDNGDEAVDVARRELPGLVLMDVTMPSKDGITATRELKAGDTTRHIPIILLTGHSESGLTLSDVQSDAILAKPIAVRQLLAQVTHFLPTI